MSKSDDKTSFLFWINRGGQIGSNIVPDGAPVPRRLMVGQQTLNLFTVVRIHAGQQKFYFSLNKKKFFKIVKLIYKENINKL